MGDMVSIKMLVAAGADPSLRSMTDGLTPLVEAVGGTNSKGAKGYPIVVDFFIRKCGVDVVSTWLLGVIFGLSRVFCVYAVHSCFSLTALPTRFPHASHTLPTCFLHASYTPPPKNVPDPSGGRPLHYAVREGHKDVAKQLLGEGAGVNAATLKHETPLMLVSAVSPQDDAALEMAMLLVSKGAKGTNIKSRALEKRVRKLIAARKAEVVERLRLAAAKQQREREKRVVQEETEGLSTFEEALRQAKAEEQNAPSRRHPQ